MNELEELTRRVAELEQFRDFLAKDTKRKISNGAQEAAQFNALRSIVEELALHAGIPLSVVQQHYEKRIRHFHALNLESMEDISPRLAADIDTRPTTDPAPDDEFPPLFPNDFR